MSTTDLKLSHFQFNKFDGSNFPAWKFKVSLLLKERELWGFVDGTEELPATVDAKALADFKQKSEKALATLCLTLADDQLVHVYACKTAKDAMERLTAIYDSKTQASKLIIRRELMQSKMVEGGDVHKHISNIKQLASKLRGLGEEINDKDIMTVLLISLPKSWETLVTTVSLKEDIDLEMVCNFILQEDTRRKATEEPEGALFSQSKNKKKPFKKQKLSCYYCGKPGHFAKNCRKKQADLKSQNQSATVAESEEHAFLAEGNDGMVWIIDSGATQHMTGNSMMVTDRTSLQTTKRVRLGDNNTYDAKEVGKVELDIGTMHNVLVVPGLAKNLFSVSQASNQGLEVVFDFKGCKIIDPKGTTVARGFRDGNLYFLLCKLKTEHVHATKVEQDGIFLWHKRYGHLGQVNLVKLHKEQMVTGIKVNHDDMPALCKGCLEGKQKRSSFPTSTTKTTEIGELTHADLSGPMQTPSLGGSRYFIQFVDDHSRRSKVYYMKSKSQALERFKEYKVMVENQTRMKLKILRTDNGGEFISKEFQDYLKRSGIVHQRTVPRTPQQNGVVERYNRTLVEMARCMIHYANLPYKFWAEAVSTAAHLKNLSPHATLKKTPEEIWSTKKPDVSYLKVFGCKAYVHVPKEDRQKLDVKSLECIFIGYAEGTKGWRFFHEPTGRIITSRDAHFDETVMERVDSVALPLSTRQDQSTTVAEEPEEECESFDDAQEGEESERSDETDGERGIDAVSNDEAEIQLRRSTRIRQPPKSWWNSPQRNALASYAYALITEDEPTTYQEATNSSDRERWQKALDEEYDSLIQNQTWELAELPPNRKAISSKWVFKIKHNSDGTVERYKARLVARGFMQKEGIDYQETYAPVVRYGSLRLLLAIANTLNLEVHQMDVKTAFLNGDLQEEIYMAQPEGYITKGTEHLVCKLKKTLYGLKQSSRAWYLKLHQFLVKQGFTKNSADYSVYSKKQANAIFIIAVYVDDIILACNDINEMNLLKKQLKANFEMKDLGNLRWFLGMEITRDRKAGIIRLSQEQYIKKVLERFNMVDCKEAATPLDPSIKMSKNMSPSTPKDLEEMRRNPYRSIVGSLMYAMIATRPDLAVAVGTLSRYLENPGMQHWNQAKRVLRYLKSTQNVGLEFKSKEGSLVGYSDADWAGDIDTRRSTTGYLFYLGQALVSWNSKLQPTVALSSTEAEYLALTAAVKEALWIRTFLQDLGIHDNNTTTVYSDNQGCLALAKNPVYHGRTKHIDVRHHFIRNNIENGDIVVDYCRTDHMPADMLTKPLARTKFEEHKSRLGLTKITQ
jgi:hypothetical protein